MNNLYEKVKRKIKALGSMIINTITEFRLEERPIFIFTMRRSGSTLLMRMIYSQDNISYISQPHLHQKSESVDALKVLPRRLEPSQKKIVNRFVDDITSANFKKWGQWNVLHKHFSFQVDRLVVKLFAFNNVIDYIAKSFDVESIYLVRHPIPVSLSLQRRDWAPRPQAHLDGVYIDQEKTEFAKSIIAKGSELQKYALEWSLANYHPLVTSAQDGFKVVTYEELVSSTTQVAHMLAAHLDLPDPESMVDVASAPSPTAIGDSRVDIVKRRPEYLVTRWTSDVSDSEQAEVDRVLTKMGINFYDAYTPYPNTSVSDS